MVRDEDEDEDADENAADDHDDDDIEEEEAEEEGNDDDDIDVDVDGGDNHHKHASVQRYTNILGVIQHTHKITYKNVHKHAETIWHTQIWQGLSLILSSLHAPCIDHTWGWSTERANKAWQLQPATNIDSMR